MAVAECSCRRIKIRKHPRFVAAANQFTEVGMEREHANPTENWHHSRERYETMENFLGGAKEADAEALKQLLGGKYGFCCQYERQCGFDTLWSVVYNTRTLYNEIAEGNPARTSFREDNRLAWGICPQKGEKKDRNI